MSDPSRPTTYTCYLSAVAYGLGLFDAAPKIPTDLTDAEAAALALGAADAKCLGKPRPMRDVLRDVENLTLLPHVATEMEAAAEAHRKAGAVAAFKALHEAVVAEVRSLVGGGRMRDVSDAMAEAMKPLGIEAGDLD